MTKLSSLQLNAPTTLLDSISRPVPIGAQIGRGGEGSVYEVQNDPTLVAKIYHKRPLPEEQVAKLQAMVSCWSSPLETIAAWPRTILYDPSSRKPCGILMIRMDDARTLHELYGTANRRRHFPDVGWHHMILAARNTAAAFQTLHAANVLVGDVNQGNLLVDKKMCVRMIDCDSFQLTANGRTFLCPVGSPHFTPPELQSQKLRDVVRTQNHDRFGLAILIFHLLFVGRHPFAGRYRGPGDLPIEKAIAERRFAFSRNRAATLVDPPPASLLLEDLPEGIGELFEAAFRTEGDANARPTPLKWIQELEGLMRFRQTCKFDAVHIFPAQLHDCPWCRIEDNGGPTFFVAAGSASAVNADRLAVYDDRILELQEIQFPDIPSNRLVIPEIPVVRSVSKLAKRTWPEWNATLLVASWVICFASLFVGGAGGWATLITGVVLSLAMGVALVLGKSACTRRKTCDDFLNWLESAQQNLIKLANLIRAQYDQRENAFKQSNEAIANEIQLYRTADKSLKDVIVNQRLTQKADFLRGFSIRDAIQKIPNLTVSQVAMLEAFSVETANDVEQLRLYGIPSIDPETVMELLNWRREVEFGFKFVQEQGLSLAETGAAKDAAVRRFKISQARKILTAAKQIETQADVAKADITRACAQFDDAVERWKVTAKQYRESQSRRRREERAINVSVPVILTCATGIPLAMSMFYLLFGK